MRGGTRIRCAGPRPPLPSSRGAVLERRLAPVDTVTGPRDEGFYRIRERHPPLKHHPARARDGEQVAVPGGLGCVAGQGAVRAMIVDELCEVGKERH